MANTITSNFVIKNSREVVLQWNLTYVDAATETNVIVYDSSAVAAALGIDDPLNCNILCIHSSNNCASTARLKLTFDATTDVHAYTIPSGFPMKHNFSHSSGLPDYAGTGKTGDILFSASGLSTGDTISLYLRIRTS